MTISPAAPATDIIVSNPTGSTDTALFDEDANSNHGRGQLFTLPDGSGSQFEITAITVKKSTAQTYANDTLTLRVFEGSQAAWDSGTGHSTANDGNDYYVDTSVTPLFEEAFTLDGALANNDYVTFEFTTPLTVTEASDFGFFMIYDRADAANPDRFRHYENGTGGGRTSITTSSHSTTSATSRQVVYFVHGTATGTPTTVTDYLELASPFQDRMVLQRDKPTNVWGEGEPNSSVSVTFDGATVNGTVDADGEWLVQLPSHSAGGPFTLTVTNGTETETVNDILVGDVWLCFGQSNMIRPLSEMTNSASYITDIAANDNIRCLEIGFDGALTEEDEAEMEWRANSTAGQWTSVGAVFAHQLNAATNAPVAIIWSAWGSSSIEGWLPLEAANELPHYDSMLDFYQSIGEYRSGTTVASRATTLGYSSNLEAITDLTENGWNEGNSTQNIFLRTRPNIIYNKRIHPLLNYSLSGFIWYQGEANADNITSVAEYRESFPRLISQYRERFGQGDLPFLSVQMPSFNQAPWPWFREVQGDVLDSVANGHYAVTLDTGLSNNIHPTDKEPIGVRLALLARKYALNEAIVADGPTYDSMTIDGDEVTINFTNADGLTTGSRTDPGAFELAGADQVFYDATDASISGSTVVLTSDSVPVPVAVRYAWTPFIADEVNLKNSDDLPAAPFRTDSWPLPGLADFAPTANADSYSTPRDQTLTIAADGVLTNDFDLNLNVLQPVVQTDVTNGSLTLNADGSFVYVPTTGFAGADSFTYLAEETDGSLTSDLVTVDITVVGESSPYYLWQSGIAWAEGDDQTFEGDPDGDGVTNFLEFALGMDPLTVDLSGLPAIATTADGAEFSFNNVQAGITYEVLLSTDLVTWSDPAFATLTSESTTPVAIPAAEAADGRVFVRLRVSE